MPSMAEKRPSMTKIFQTSVSEHCAKHCCRCWSMLRQRRCSDTSRYCRVEGYA